MKPFPFSLLIIIVLLFGCSKDDSPFVDGENTDLTAIFYGKTWSIYEVEGNGRRVPVPDNGECGRDYFRYLENGEYIEYIYNNDSCIPEINRLNFTLEGNFITLSDGGESADVRILKLDDSNFNFETSLDIDGNGIADKVKLFCQIYSPKDRDIYSDTFEKDFFKFQDDKLIAFTWAEYVGDRFKHYEIFRASNSCSKNDAVKIATITDPSETEFVDLDPEPTEELCYFFRLQTDSGTLSESDLVTINTRDLDVFKVAMLPAQVAKNNIKLNWQQYENPYFQRYEITVSQKAHYSGSTEEIPIVTIEEQETTTFTIETPPSVDDPFYNIHVYNIFGERSSLDRDGQFTETSVEVSYSPDEVVDMYAIRLLASDPSESNYVYLWGESVTDSYKKIKKYDVYAKMVVAESSFDLNTSSEVRLKVLESSEGKEVFIQKGSEYHVFDAQTLEYKYRFRDLNNEHITFDDLLHFKDDIWVIADGGDELRTVRRIGRDLQTIDILDPDPATIFKRMNDLIRIDENQILGGVLYDDRSFLFQINDDGTIAGANEVGFSFADRSNSIVHNAVSNILLDKRYSRIYSSDDYSFINSYSTPIYTSTLSLDGEHILGTNYNGHSSLDFYEVFDRELNLLNWRNGQTTTINTVGYPQYVYENQDGKLVVISSYFKRSSLWRGESKNDLFAEVYDWP